MLLTFQVVATGLGTLTFLLIARALGTSSFGAFAAVLGLAQAASLFLDAGLGTFLLRELTSASATSEAADLIPSALRLELRLILAAIPLGALTTLCATGSTRLALVAALLIGYVGILTLSTSIEAVFRSLRRVKRVGSAVTIEKATALTLVALALAARGGIVAIGIALFVSGLARLLFDYTSLIFGIPPQRNAAQMRWSAKRLLLRSLPFAGTALVLASIPRLDVTIVAASSLKAAAYFAVGDRLVVGPLSFSAVFSQALFPHLGRGVITAGRALLMQSGVGLLGSLCVIVLAGPLARVAFHESGSEAVTTVRLMSLALPFSFLSSGLLVQAYTHKLESSIWVATLAASLLGTLGVFVGVLVDPPKAVAVAYVGRQALICASLLILIGRKRGSIRMTGR